MQTAQTHTASNGISYALHLEAEARFWAEIGRVLDGGAKRVCDVGGGAKPILPLRRIDACGLDYVVLDESLEQLERAPEGYERYEASILDEVAVARLVADRGPFDAVISRWTAEHIPDGKGFHERIFEMLRPGGTTVHLFPTLYSVPFVINRVLSPKPSAAVLFRTSPARKAKFRPYYSWCRGPSAGQIRRLQEIGYSVESYTGFFGHSFYSPLGPLHDAHQRIAEALVRHPVAAMTSFALVVLRRPD